MANLTQNQIQSLELAYLVSGHWLALQDWLPNVRHWFLLSFGLQVLWYCTEREHGEHSA